MVGIYKLTSPSLKVYIGQSWNIEKRLKYYNEAKPRDQTPVYNSIRKYGSENHTKEIVCELPFDITQDELDRYEIFFIEQYTEAGYLLLNATSGGCGGKLSPESIQKIKEKRAKQKPPTLGFKFSEESIKKRSDLLKGRKLSPEHAAKCGLAMKGKKFSEESKNRLKAVMAEKKVWVGRKHSEESKLKMALAKLGKKRGHQSPEHREKIGATNKEIARRKREGL